MSAGLLPLLKQMLEMSKKATLRTAGIVGDDLAINSSQLIDGAPDRKLPMVLAVGKGSLRNKFLILIPAALVLSTAAPGLVLPLVSAGGAYLCWEGVEKFIEKRKLKNDPDNQPEEKTTEDPATWEKNHIKKAVRTDFILSSEITAVSLWMVEGQKLLVQLGAMAASGLAMTVGVYGVVGALIHLGDIGHKLRETPGKNIFSKTLRRLGSGMERTGNPLIRVVGVAGSVAMFLVGGSMLLHGIPGADTVAGHTLSVFGNNPVLHAAATGVLQTAAGVAAGILAVPPMKLVVPVMEKLAARVKKLGLKKLLPGKKKKDPSAAVVPPPLESACSFTEKSAKSAFRGACSVPDEQCMKERRVVPSRRSSPGIV